MLLEWMLSFVLLRNWEVYLPNLPWSYVEIKEQWEEWEMNFFQILTLEERYKDAVSEYVYLDPDVISFDELRYLEVLHMGFDGCVHRGEIIVHEQVAEEVLELFKELYRMDYPIEKMHVVSKYGYSDDLSMLDNNSSGFNFRYIAGTRKLSQHSYGLAIDINPLLNPYIIGEQVLPAAGVNFVNREQDVAGMIKQGDAVYEVFKRYGWEWGGDWADIKDYHHFEKRVTAH